MKPTARIFQENAEENPRAQIIIVGILLRLLRPACRMLKYTKSPLLCQWNYSADLHQNIGYLFGVDI